MALVPKLPRLFDDERGRFLVQRIASCARTDLERRLYRSIVRHAYEDVLPLRSLYDDIAGVFTDEPLAVAHFRAKLDGAIGRLPESGPGGSALAPEGSEWPNGLGSDVRSLVPNPDGPFPSPCPGDIGPFVDPMSIAWIGAAIDRVSQGNEGTYQRGIAAVDMLWRATDTIDVLYRDASRGVDPAGRDHLRDRLDQLDRDTRPDEYGGRGGFDARGGLSGLRDLDGPLGGGFGAEAMPVPDGTYPEPDDWPPIPRPEDDVPIVWPPRGGGGGGGRIPPRRQFDPCELMLDICRHLVLGGARGLRPTRLPDAAYASGITSISPTAACVGETITIHGTFPPSRPADVIVMIGGLPAPIVSWSATAIVVRVPAGAKSGCVGFRNERVEGSNQREWQRQQDSLAAVSEGLNCLGVHTAFVPMPFVPARPPCTPFNYFAGTIPEI
ncbi:MAG TPA: IPT/TIG domain-containing protein, partial [Candidatus Limnocylindrales bacterium]|nr:IPT/TIG domain-containing protein [Candidatus Limnocylindrales bacterium]